MVYYLNKKKYSCLNKNRFICESIMLFIMNILDVGFNNIKVVSGVEIEIISVAKYIYPLIFFLKKHSICLFKTLIDIVCYDIKGQKFRFFICYNLLSICYNLRVKIFN